MAVLRPENEEEVVRVLLERYERGSPVAVVGSGGKSGWGETVAAEDSLDLSGLSGVTLYEPNELVLSARAGTPLSMIETLLAENDQELAFEPMDAAPLFGGASGQATLGGTLAANVSGPRRIKAGAARDHVLGIRAVSGWGELFKSGGRVVKNVTGYDLSRGLSGSWGTLAVFTEITLKVLPKAPDSATLVVLGLNDAAGVDLLCAAMGSPWEVSSAAHVPAALSANLPVDLGAGGRALTLMRLEGVGPSVDYRAEKLRALAGDLEAVLVADTESRALWRHLRDASFFAGGQGPNAALTPCDQAPYYAARFVLSDLGTKGGVLTDAAARVLRADGTPIPGLYASSNSTASLFGGVYPGPGAPLGSAMVFASLAVGEMTGLAPNLRS